eukprot:574163-Hanusia_phi.AAC.1
MAFGGTRYRSTVSGAARASNAFGHVIFVASRLHRVRFGMRWGWSGLLAAGRIAVSLRLRTGLRSDPGQFESDGPIRSSRGSIVPRNHLTSLWPHAPRLRVGLPGHGVQYGRTARPVTTGRQRPGAGPVRRVALPRPVVRRYGNSDPGPLWLPRRVAQPPGWRHRPRQWTVLTPRLRPRPGVTVTVVRSGHRHRPGPGPPGPRPPPGSDRRG